MNPVLTEPTVEAPPESDIISETLHWVNEERVRRGMAPIEALPKGTPGKSMGCPLALALHGGENFVSVGPSTYCDEEDSYDLPSCARTFVSRFDARSYPELIA